MIAFADGSVKFQRHAAALSVDASNRSHDEIVLGNIPAVQDLCNQALALDTTQGI